MFVADDGHSVAVGGYAVMKLVMVNKAAIFHLGRKTAEADVAAVFLKGRSHFDNVGRDYVETAIVTRKGLRHRKSGVIGVLHVRALEKFIENDEKSLPLTDFFSYTLDAQHFRIEVAVTETDVVRNID